MTTQTKEPMSDHARLDKIVSDIAEYAFFQGDLDWVCEQLKSAWKTLEVQKSVLRMRDKQNYIMRDALEKIKTGSCCNLCECHSCDAKEALQKCAKV